MHVIADGVVAELACPIIVNGREHDHHTPPYQIRPFTVNEQKNKLQHY
jgi:hypothetical protein